VRIVCYTYVLWWSFYSRGSTIAVVGLGEQGRWVLDIVCERLSVGVRLGRYCLGG
jgi:hypothetical protein